MTTEEKTLTPDTRKKSIHAGHRERIRARYRKSGMDDFAPHEVLEYVLTFAMPRGDVNETAHYLIDRFGSGADVLDATEDELLACPGVGDVTACMLKMSYRALHPYMRRQPDRAYAPSSRWTFL